MPAIFLRSDSLNRLVYLPDVNSLTYKELATLRAELNIDIESMEGRMYEQRDEASSEWLCSISYKLSICRQFLELCKHFLDHREKQNYANIVLDCVAEHCGKDAARNCRRMAREKAKAAKEAIS